MDKGWCRGIGYIGCSICVDQASRSFIRCKPCLNRTKLWFWLCCNLSLCVPCAFEAEGQPSHYGFTRTIEPTSLTVSCTTDTFEHICVTANHIAAGVFPFEHDCRFNFFSQNAPFRSVEDGLIKLARAKANSASRTVQYTLYCGALPLISALQVRDSEPQT